MTNQFTDEQIEAGAKAYWLASEREIHDKPITWEWDKEERRRYMWAARQVLAGVAPQAPSVDRASLIARLAGSVDPLGVTCGECGSKPGKRCYGGGEMYRPHPSRKGKAERELMLEAADALAAPVQPSSTVDEGKLAEVIRRSYENEQGLKIRDDKRTARAVAKWLKEQGR